MSTPLTPSQHLAHVLINAFQDLEVKANANAQDAAFWQRRAASLEAKYKAMKAEKNVYKELCEVNNIIL